MSDMSLTDFVNNLLSDVVKFREMWESGAASMPENYPTEMGEGEWYEQWLAFISDVGGIG